MNLSPDPADYLTPCDVIDFQHPDVARVAASLTGANQIETAARCFAFVRDQIRHSSDHQLNPVTCRASDVLKNRTGFCYAKSHLLAALLRVNGIPAGLCYQRLSIAGDLPPFCIHGLNSVFLAKIGWYRIDARGNRSGIDAQFDPPHERLAFPIAHPNECDFPGVHVRPLPSVVECLTCCNTWQEVSERLPDVTVDEFDVWSAK